MPEKFHNKYRIPSARAQWWDYGENAAYFITICTKKHIPFLGKVENQKMHLSPAGVIVEKDWLAVPEKYTFIILDEFVVMPNHFHGIIIINKKENNFETSKLSSPVTKIISRQKEGGITGKKNPMFYENLSRILREFKGKCTFEIHKELAAFEWQGRFHDHIIRSEKEYQSIRNYIFNNPANWEKDKFYNTEKW